MSGCSGSCGSCGGGCGVPEGDYQIFAGVDRIPGFKVVGVSAVISGGEAASADIEALWKEFFARKISDNIEVADNDAIMAVYSEYEGKDRTKPYRLTIGYELSEGQEVPDGLFGVDIQEDEYALIRAGGEQPKVMNEAWETIKDSDLKCCFRTDFEVYGPDFPEEDEHEVLIAVGIDV